MSTSHEEFARSLRTAIEASGLSYRALAEAVTAADGAMSAPTLRAWASGRSVPTRRASFSSLAVLERVLGMGPGMLERYLHERPSAAEAGAASSRLRELVGAVEDLRESWQIQPFLSATRDLLISSLVLEGPCGGTVTHRSVMRAVHDGVGRLLIPVDPMGWSVTEEEDWSVSLRGGRLGRFARLDPTVAIIEVVLHRPLRAGEVSIIDFSHAISERTRTTGWFSAISLIPTAHLIGKVTAPSGSGPWYFRRSAVTLDGTVHAPLSRADGSAGATEIGEFGDGYDCTVSGSTAAIATVCWSQGEAMPEICAGCD